MIIMLIWSCNPKKVYVVKFAIAHRWRIALGCAAVSGFRFKLVIGERSRRTFWFIARQSRAFPFAFEHPFSSYLGPSGLRLPADEAPFLSYIIAHLLALLGHPAHEILYLCRCICCSVRLLYFRSDGDIMVLFIKKISPRVNFSFAHRSKLAPLTTK